MGVILSLKGRKAIFRRGEWRSSHRGLEDRLNGLMNDWIAETGGPRLASSDPEREVVEAIATRTGARVLLSVRANPRREARIYLGLRQMSLPFDD